MVQRHPPLRLAHEAEVAPGVGPGTLRGEPASGAATPDLAAFQRVVLSNLDAAHNLAWWLVRNDAEAADIVQEACLKAWRGFGSFRGGDGCSWLLAIVRTTAYSQMRRGEGEDVAMARRAGVDRATEAERVCRFDGEAVRAAMGRLPAPQREVLVLCDLEGLTYAQIGLVIGVPAGTVMSRLSRARDALRERLLGEE
jgi:RNA polymerase sigma-70 factor (ECF subfamily)